MSSSSAIQSFYKAHPTEVIGLAATIVAVSAYVYRVGGIAEAKERLEVFFAGNNGKQARVISKEERLLKHVFNRAAEDDAQSVLNVIDDFGHKTEWLMNVGDEKGALLKNEIVKKQPKVAVEFGSYLGYSAVLMASNMPAGSHLYSVDIDPLHSAIATKIVEFAGLKDRVTFLVGTVEDKLHQLQSKYGVSTIDLLFIDHHKAHYLKDLKQVEQLGFLKKGSVVVGDNILYPGAPDYREYVRNNPNYVTKEHETHVEYTTDKDIVTVSVRN